MAPRLLCKFAFRVFLLCSLAAATLKAAEKTNLVRQVDANTFEIGAVRLEKKERRLIIPSTVNMLEGPIEYVLVSALGKLHESIFKTSVDPIHIHTAALLLVSEPLSTNTAPKVRISVQTATKDAVPVEELIDNTAVEKRLKPGLWRYNGSRLVDGTFIAQRDGSVLAIIADPDALVENGRVSADDDENWRPRKAELPPVGTPVKIILTFDPAK